MMSSGVSCAWPISCRMTPRSRSQLVRVESRVLQDVGDDVDGERHVLLQHLGVVGGVLARGVGVELAADRLDLLGDGAGDAPLGALERHVLEEVRDAVDARRSRGACRRRPRRRARPVSTAAIGSVTTRRPLARVVTLTSLMPSLLRSAPQRHARVDQRLHRREVVGQHGRTAPAASIRSASRAGSAGRTPVALRPRRGTWPDGRSPARPSARSASRRCARAAAIADGGVRIDQLAGALRQSAMVAPACPRRRAGRASNSARAPRQRIGADRERAAAAEARPSPRPAPAVAAVELEQQALEIARDLDVHARATGRRHDRAVVMSPVAKKRARMSLRLVADDEAARSAGPCAGRRSRQRRCRNCRSARRRRPPARARRAPAAADVVDDLASDPRPVDRVDRRQRIAVAEREVVEQRLHQVLAVVEGAFDGDVVDVGRQHGRHLPALHLGDAGRADAG